MSTRSDFLIAITQLAAERNLPRDTVLAVVEAALASAYKKDGPFANQDIQVKLSPQTGEVKVFALKTVVEEPRNANLEISLADAQKHKKGAALGDVIVIEVASYQAGRIAAQTAKQVVMQRLKEAEREAVYQEFAGKEGDIVSGVIQRFEPRQVIVDLGRVEAVLPAEEQVPSERYRVGQRMKFYVLEVSKVAKGPQVVVSRSHRNLLRRLFELEVPEIFNGLVDIKSIAREPGARSKVAVAARQEGIDPVGSCIGLRGLRIQNIVTELRGEKVDVVQWHSNPATFIANSLSPAQVLTVGVSEGEKAATAVVPDRQLSLAIGKEGQNARLAAWLTGWRIDIKSSSDYEAQRAEREAKAAAEREAREVAERVAREAVVAEAAAVAEAPATAEVVAEAPPEKVTPIPEVEEERKAKEPVLVAAASLHEIRFVDELPVTGKGKETQKAKGKGKKEDKEGPGKKGRKAKVRRVSLEEFEEE